MSNIPEFPEFPEEPQVSPQWEDRYDDDMVQGIMSLFKKYEIPLDDATPHRWVRMWDEMLAGYEEDVEAMLTKAIEKDEKATEMIVCKDIEMYSTCVHHLLPFIGKVHIAYIPDGRLVGLSKMPRLVDAFARQLQLQERLTYQIALAFNDVIKPKGVAVVIEAAHMCVRCRGVQKQNCTMVTSHLIGTMRKALARAEFFSLLGMK